MDNYANKPPTLAALGCVLLDVYHMRPSRTFSPTDPHWRVLRRPYGHLRRQVHHPRYIAFVRLLAGSAGSLHGHSRQWLHIGGYCGGPHKQFRRQAHHPRNNGLRANWRLLHAALMDDLAAQPSLALTAVALMESFAYMPTSRTTMYCELMGVYCMRSSWTTSPTGRLHCAGTGLLDRPREGVKPLRLERALNLSGPPSRGR
jgi:hypothetical protein